MITLSTVQQTDFYPFTDSGPKRYSKNNNNNNDNETYTNTVYSQYICTIAILIA
jgi:hypothetical protein